MIRNKLKKRTKQWFADFREKHGRDAQPLDLEPIQEDINEFNLYNKRYIVMKAKTIRQGTLGVEFFTKNQPVKQVEMLDPSMKRMKEEISTKDQKNQALN